jgi:phage shock protein B
VELNDTEITTLAIVGCVMLCCVVFPVGLPILLHHRRESRKMAGSAVDQKMVAELMAAAQRMEQRLGYLENVLDTEVPGWRNRSDVR